MIGNRSMRNENPTYSPRITASILMAFVLALAVSSAFGQEEPSVILVDGFGRVGCGDAQARTDAFVTALGNEPMAGGLIVVFPQGSDPVPAFSTLQDIMTQFRMRNFGEGRVDILIGPALTEMAIQFLMLPPGSSKYPPEPGTVTELGPPKGSKPIKFGSTVPVEGPVCGTAAYDLNVFALAVNQIPSVKARVVVKARNASRTKAIRAEIREEIGKRIEISSVTFLNVKSQTEGVELWLVPVNNAGRINKIAAEDNARLSALQDIEIYSKEIKGHPDDPDAYVQRARAFVKAERLADAIGDLTKAIAVSKHPYYVAQSTIERGEVYLRQKSYAAAIADFAAVIELNGADAYKAPAYLKRALAYHEGGRNDAAREDVNQAIKLYTASKVTGKQKGLAQAYRLREALK